MSYETHLAYGLGRGRFGGNSTGDTNSLRGVIHSFDRVTDYCWLSFDTPRRNPKLPRDLHGIDRRTSPPGLLVAKAMVVPVVSSTQRDREFVADLASHRARLSEPQMVGVSRASPANQTRLRCNELEVRFIAMPTRLADRQLAFLDFGGRGVGLKMC